MKPAHEVKCLILQLKLESKSGVCFFFVLGCAHFFFFWFCSEACAELVIGPRSRLNGNLAFSFPGLAATRLASLCDFAARLYLLRTGAGSRSAAAFTARRYGWEALWLLARSPKFSFFSFFFQGSPSASTAHPLPHGTRPSTSLVHSSPGREHACLPPHTLPVVEPQ